MRMCIKCNKEKGVTEFTRRRKGSEERRTICTKCCRQYQHAHYIKYKKNYVERAKLFNGKQRMKNRRLMFEFLQNKSCQDCGNNDIRVLEFDHKSTLDKSDDVSNMINRYSWKVVLKEIGKCEIRCANCHRIKTSKQFDFFKTNLSQISPEKLD